MPRTSEAKGQAAALWIVLALLVASLSILVIPSSPTPNAWPVHGLTTGRDPYLWPFTPDSIWNLPIGANAIYVSAHTKRATSYGMTTDPDVIVLTPAAPNTAVYQNNDGWSGGSRCDPQGGVLFSGPIPTDFVVPGATGSSTPNYATAILMPDNHTLAQGQPMARCTAGGSATMMWYQEKEDLYGTGFSGAHGGSMLSSIGGTIRLGELVPGGTIRHVLKINLYAHDDYFYNGSTKGYRWPATTADSYASSVYGGTVPALRMGSLLALPPGINIASLGLETQPAQILAKAFQDYGAYTVDDTGWSVYAIETEFSPSGHVENEFQSAWGFSMTPSSKNTPWARDMDRIFGNLSVVDDWDASMWRTVSQSNGTLGAGGGAPRVPWAPPFGASSPPPPLTANFTYSPSNPVAGQSTTFSGSASGGNPPYTYGWKFGDGMSGTGATVSHTYGSAGTYTVKLTVTDSNATSALVSKQVVVSSPPPPPPPLTANFTFLPTQPETGQTVTFTGTASGGSPPYTFAWAFGDGSTATGANVSHAYGQAGNYTAVLTATDAASRTATATRTIPVTAQPPPSNEVTVSNPTAGTIANATQEVTVSWTSSGSLQTNSASLSFSSDGGGSWNLPFATGQPLNGSMVWQVPNVTTNDAIVRVVVKDTRGSDVEGRSGVFLIEAAAPPGNPTAPGTPKAVLSTTPAWPTPSESVDFNGSTSSPSNPNDTLQARWDWTNDGTWDTGWSSALIAIHAYSGQGIYTVRLEVGESSGGTGNATASVVVDGSAPKTTATVNGTQGKRGWYISLVTVTLSAADPLSGVAATFYRVDGASWLTYVAPFSLDNGRHKVSYYSVDRAGNAESMHTIKVNVDRTLPTFGFVSPTGMVSSSRVLVTWNATNEVSSPINYTTSVDGSPFGPEGANSFLLELLADGAHTIVVNAISDSGLSVAATISFGVDTNVFSFRGPYSGIPTVAVVAILGVALAVRRHRVKARRRRKRDHTRRGRFESRAGPRTKP